MFLPRQLISIAHWSQTAVGPIFPCSSGSLCMTLVTSRVPLNHSLSSCFWVSLGIGLFVTKRDHSGELNCLFLGTGEDLLSDDWVIAHSGSAGSSSTPKPLYQTPIWLMPPGIATGVNLQCHKTAQPTRVRTWCRVHYTLLHQDQTKSLGDVVASRLCTGVICTLMMQAPLRSELSGLWLTHFMGLNPRNHRSLIVIEDQVLTARNVHHKNPKMTRLFEA